MDCYTCTLQEGNENKALCATLLLPAMIKRLSAQIQELSALERTPIQINEVQLLNTKENANDIETYKGRAARERGAGKDAKLEADTEQA
jgi:hypothetical protein